MEIETASQFSKINVKTARDPDSIGQNVRLLGWVQTRRDSNAGFSFLEINDGSCLGNVQVIARQELADYESLVLKLTTGCSIEVLGKVTESAGKGQVTEIVAESVHLIGSADPEEYPLQKRGKGERHSMEKLREWAPLRDVVEPDCESSGNLDVRIFKIIGIRTARSLISELPY